METSDDFIINELVKIYFRYRHSSNEFNLLHYLSEIQRKHPLPERIALNSTRFLDIEEKIQRYGLVEKTPTKEQCLHCYQITDKGITIHENGGWLKYKKKEKNWLLKNNSENLKFLLGSIIAIVAIIVAYLTSK